MGSFKRPVLIRDERRLAEFEQAATNLLGYFRDGEKAQKDAVINNFWLICGRASAEIRYAYLDDVLASKDAKEIERAFDFAIFGFAAWSHPKNETEWLLGQSCGAVAVMCHYTCGPKPAKQGGILEMIVEMYAAVRVARAC